MRALKFFEKQPAEIQDYFLSFDRWLTAMGDTAATHSAAVVNVTPGAVSPDDDATIDGSALANNEVVIRLSGGTHGNVYKVTGTLTSTSGLVKESDIMVRVIEV